MCCRCHLWTCSRDGVRSVPLFIRSCALRVTYNEMQYLRSYPIGKFSRHGERRGAPCLYGGIHARVRSASDIV